MCPVIKLVMHNEHSVNCIISMRKCMTRIAGFPSIVLRVHALCFVVIWYWTILLLFQGLFCVCAQPMRDDVTTSSLIGWAHKNKANLRDLIAATGLVISNWIQIVNFSARVTVKFDWWPCKTIGHLFYATSSFVHHFVAIGEYKLELQSGNTHPIWVKFDDF